MLDAICNFIQSYPAVDVAICALGFTAYSTYLSRRHAKLAVQPFFATWSTFDVAQGTNPPSGKVEVFLQNSGLGPAIVTKFEVLFKGVPSTASDHLELREDAMKFLVSHGINSRNLGMSYIRKGHVIGKDGKIQLCWGTLENTPGDFLKKMRAEIAVRIEYKSAYKVKGVYDTREHDNVVMAD